MHNFVGHIDGHIVSHEKGIEGFGYDSLFIPRGFTTTFAMMSPNQKNSISHRTRAIEQLRSYLALHNL